MPTRAHVDPLPHATARVVLRRFAAADLRPFQAYRCDPEVARYQGWSAMDDVAAAAFIADMAAAPFGVPGEWFQLAVAERATGMLVGDIGLVLAVERPGVAEIGFSMSPAVQRRGLGTEAVRGALALLFQSLRVEAVEGITDARNAASIRLLERVGMRRVRTQHAEFKGAPCTEFVYELARAQWRPAAGDYQ